MLEPDPVIHEDESAAGDEDGTRKFDDREAAEVLKVQ